MFRLRIVLHGNDVKEIELEPGREYTAGRSSSCDIVLEDQPGVSRNHFRLSDEGGQWRLLVTSKFGDVTHNGQPVAELPLHSDTVFSLSSYDFHFSEARQETGERGSPSANLPVQSTAGPRAASPMIAPTGAVAPYYGGTAAPRYETAGSEPSEATMVASVDGVPYLRIVDSRDGSEEVLRLEGNLWCAGREEDCEIFLNDTKASRRQFELAATPSGFYVTDLGSSNGTNLNGSPLPPDEPVPIRSGDVISVHKLALHFEIRDPNFKNKLTVIPNEVLNAPALMAPHLPLDPAYSQYPMPAAGSGGVIKLDHSLHFPKRAPAKKKNFRLILGAAALVLVVAAVFSGGNEKKPEQAPPANAAFEKLTPAQKQLVKETYLLARNLFLQTKYAMAAAQFKKLHEILPEGFEDSRKLADDCEAAYQTQDQINYIKAQEAMIARNKARLDEILKTCEKIANASVNEEEIKTCLNEAITLDPENPQIADQISRVTKRAEENRLKVEQQREYQDRVQRGRAMYKKALNLEKEGDWLEAIAGYEKFAEAGLPDPDGNVTKAKQAVASLKQSIGVEVEKRLQAAQQAYDQGNFRSALDNIDKAKNLDPENEKAAELGGKYKRELTSQLQALYEDSIVEEGLGNVPAATEKWRKIIDLDRVDGDYYRRAKNKLRTYGVR